MTKKHFEMLANIMKFAKPPEDRGFNKLVSALLSYHSDICNSLADGCQSENPRFDRQRFLKACGVD